MEINGKIVSSLAGAVLLFFANATCVYQAGDPELENGNSAITDTFSLVDDTEWQRGLSLRGTNTAIQDTGNFIFPFGGTAQSARWMVAEWGSRHPLSGEGTVMPNGEIVYANSGKLLGFHQSEAGVQMRMELLADQEYDKPRMDGEYWPHLLLEQAFGTPVRLADMAAL